MLDWRGPVSIMEGGEETLALRLTPALYMHRTLSTTVLVLIKCCTTGGKNVY